MATSKDHDVAASLMTDNALMSRINGVFSALSQRREALGLSNPGTVDGIAKEVQRDVFLNNLSFTGLRADLTKAFSLSPMFQIQHALAGGSQALAPYTFNALYGSPRVFLQASLDNDLQMSGRANYRWTPSFVTKTSAQIAPGGSQSMVSIENDYSGADFSASLKAMNPSVLDDGLTGIYVGSYLQSITPRLALGLEGVWQRAGMKQGPELLLSYAAKYKGNNWIASAQLLAQGGLQGTYWRRLTDKVEAGVDMNLYFAGIGLAGAGGLMGGFPRSEGVATFGAKYDFTASTYRAQVDSQGRVACLLEKRVAPSVQFTFSGEIDHSKNQVKLGLGVSIEAAGDEIMAQQETMTSATASLPPPI